MKKISLLLFAPLFASAQITLMPPVVDTPTSPEITNIVIDAVAPYTNAPSRSVVTNIVTEMLSAALPAAGCTQLYGVTPQISGATYTYLLVATNNYTLSVAAGASRKHYSLEVMGAYSCTLSAGMRLRGTWTPTGTNIVSIVPSTGTVYNVYGRGL